MSAIVQPLSTLPEAGTPESLVSVAERYGNFIGGSFVAPIHGRYRTNRTPVTGAIICEVADSTEADVELALDAAHAAKTEWAQRSPAERAAVFNAIADAMEANLEMLAIAESWDNGEPVRETLAADLPLAIDHFRYFAGAVRAEDRVRRPRTGAAPRVVRSGRDLAQRHRRGPGRPAARLRRSRERDDGGAALSGGLLMKRELPSFVTTHVRLVINAEYSSRSRAARTPEVTTAVSGTGRKHRSFSSV